MYAFVKHKYLILTLSIKTFIQDNIEMSPKFWFPFLERKKFQTVNKRISTLENTDHSNDESDLKDSD